MKCTKCGAEWHLDYGMTGFHWASLVKGDASGRASKELLEKKREPHFWFMMAIEGLKLKAPVVHIVPDKGTDVVNKVICPYCRRLYDESKDNCPYCGGHR